MHQKNVIFFTIGVLNIFETYYKHNYEPYLCIGCHDLMQKAISFNDAAIFYAKGSAYRIHFWYMSKDDGNSIMNNSNLTEKVFCNFLLRIKDDCVQP